MNKTNILVTGANSQLGKILQNNIPKNLRVHFFTKDDLDITNIDDVKHAFNNNKYNYCLNFAAYTDVNKAENEKEKCYNVNVNGLINLADLCKEHECTLIQISTDFVFDGTKKHAYLETDQTKALNYYGYTKLKAEEYIIEHLKKYIIIRTSWLYSEYNRNFVKSIISLSKKNDNLKIVDNQQGTPTNAHDLIKFIDLLISKIEKDLSINYYGLYHFSNLGKCSWYSFAKKIVKTLNLKVSLHPISDKEYITPAKRPSYSVLSKEKVMNIFAYSIPDWEQSLEKFLLNKFKND
jgi:dTDP-4-dehydrorhamnose reductase